SVHLYPFEMAVKAAHAHALMASYNEWDRVPNHVNHRLLTDILRTEWGFDGFVMSDGGGIESVVDEHHAAAGYAEAGILCIEAGVDFGGGGKGRCFSTLADEERAGKVSMAAIDRAAAGVLRVKLLSGLFDHRYADPDYAEKVNNCDEHKELARLAADEAMVVALKSDAVVLVLGENELLRREAWSEQHLGDRDTLDLVGRQHDLAR